MPQLKKCPHCGNVLVCQKCGKRVTPDFHRGGRKKILATYMAETEVAQLKARADKEGISVAELIRNMVSGTEKALSKGGKKKAGSRVGANKAS